ADSPRRRESRSDGQGDPESGQGLETSVAASAAGARLYGRSDNAASLARHATVKCTGNTVLGHSGRSLRVRLRLRPGCHESVTSLSFNARLRSGVLETLEHRSQIMSVFKAKRVALAVAAMAIAASALAADISGAGATFPYPIYSKWADAYKQQTGIGLNYQ